MTEEAYMRRAIELARQGEGWVSPNPMVGAVIVKDGRILGEGYHARAGLEHAERVALRSCAGAAAGATMYVTLEPCCHHGRQPPCTDALIESGIARVVVGSRDPNPLVAGRGVALLRAAGIQVQTDFLREQCDALNPVFFHYITTRTPYVVMKYGMTADGKIATRTGASQWISSEASRRHAHGLRHRYSAIMVGIGTVEADDPLLTCRLPDCRTPVRVICDSTLRISPTCNICRTAHTVPTFVACARPDPARQRALEALGVTVLCLPGADGRVDLNALMVQLGRAGIDSLMLEGGSMLNEAALRAGIVRRVMIYLAPKIFGGVDADTPVAGLGVETPADAVLLSAPTVTPIGSDLLLEYEVM